MGRGRQSRQKVADRVRHQARYERYREEHGRPFEPRNPHSPSSVFSHIGEAIGMGFTDGYEYSLKRAVAKEIANQRLEVRPLWQIAISDRRIHAKQWDERRVALIRNHMRDRSELKSGQLDEFDDVEWGTFEAS